MSKEAMKLALEALQRIDLWLKARYQVGLVGVELEAIKALEEALAKQEHGEPVCWITPDGEGWRMRLDPPVNDVPLGWTALFDKPQQRKPLTDEQIDLLLLRKPELSWFNENGHRNIARAIEKAHGIKE